MDTAALVTSAHALEDQAAALVGYRPRPGSPWWRWARDLRATEGVDEALVGEADGLYWRVVLAHKGLARKLGGRGELEADALLGLYRAAVNFDPEAGTRFSTYAGWWVRSMVQKGRDHGPIRVPHRAAVARISYQRALAAAPAGTDPADVLEDVLDSYDMDRERYEHAARAYMVDSLDATLPGGQLRGHTLAAPNGLPSHALEAKRRRMEAARLIDTLEPRLRHVVVRRYGLDGEGGATLQEVGDELGLSKERIRQLELMALQRMRWEIR